MAVIIYSGLPGTGKTASATYQAVKTYKKQNSLFLRLMRYINTLDKENIKKIKLTSINLKNYYVNNVYSNYPIVLNERNKTYSNIVQPHDLTMIKQFPKQSIIILDETQRYFDSREFKTFPKELGVFLQHHRHADILDIILVTQHPRRLDNKMRDLSEIFRKYRLFIKLPFLPIILTTYTNYYEFEEYGKYNKVKKEMKTYDYDNHIKVLFTRNVFSRYNSKYFSVIFEALPMIRNNSFNNINLSSEDIKKIGLKL